MPIAWQCLWVNTQSCQYYKLLRSDSFLFGVFNGKIQGEHIFPYPKVFDEDTVAEMQTFFDSAKDAFHENSDPLQNELREGVTDEQWQLIQDFGMMGMQVPEEYEGLALTNTQFARMSEIGGGNDLGVSIFIGAHQSIGFKAILIQGTKDQKLFNKIMSHIDGYTRSRTNVHPDRVDRPI